MAIGGGCGTTRSIRAAFQNWNSISVLIVDWQAHCRVRIFHPSNSTTTTSPCFLRRGSSHWTPRCCGSTSTSSSNTSRRFLGSTATPRTTHGNWNATTVEVTSATTNIRAPLSLHPPPPTQVPKRRRRRLQHRTTGLIAVACQRRSDHRRRVRYCFGCGAQILHDPAVESHNNNDGPTTTKPRTTPAAATPTTTTRLNQKDNYWHRQHRKLRQSQLKNWALCDRCRRVRQHDRQQQQCAHHPSSSSSCSILGTAGTGARPLQGPDDKKNTTNNDAPSRQQWQLQEEQLLLLEDLSPTHDMVQAFHEQVRQIRQVPHAVVIVCVDARNIRGTLLSSPVLRRYVGGHAILLAVLRCDLLPPPQLHHHSTRALDDDDDNMDDESNQETDRIQQQQQQQQQLKEYYADRARALHPAAVYLCSCGEPAQQSPTPQSLGRYDGLRDLATDLWQHLHGRDCYVVGPANIGKSTLVDTLVAAFLNRGHRENHFRDRRGRHRYHTLQRLRVTTSAGIAGTTLQNVRIPCFANHTQALWDTPGLLLEERLRSIFPMRNLQALQAQRPQPVVPQSIMNVDMDNDAVDRTRSFALIIAERDDPQWPLLRVEVRLKKKKSVDDQDENFAGFYNPSVECLWNSLLPGLQMRIMSIEQCRVEEQERAQRVSQQQQQQQQHEPAQREQKQASAQPKTAEETLAYRQAQRRDLEQEQERLRAQLGVHEYEKHRKRQQKERATAVWERRREKLLATLVPVQEQVVTVAGANGSPLPVGVDLAVAHVGWFTFHMPRTALVRTFVPHVGVRAALQPPLGLPPNWGPYEPWRDPKEARDQEEEEEDDDDDIDDEEIDEELMLKEELEEYYGENQNYNADFSYDDSDEILSASNEEELRASYHEVRDSHHKLSDDPWAAYRGEAIGWHWDGSLPLTLQQWNPISNNKRNPATQQTEKRHRRTG